MVNIFVEPIKINIEIQKGENIHDGLGKAGINIETPCGGHGICGSCKVLAIEPDIIPPTPHDNISIKESLKGVRLACMAIPESDTSIRLGQNYIYNISETPTIIEQNYTYNIDFRKPSEVQILSCGISYIHNSKNSNWMEPNKVNSKYDKHSLDAPTPKSLGLAIDIGTTTLVVSIVSLANRKVLVSESSLNPQVVHGHDVLSRINYSSTPNRLFEMAYLVRDKIDWLIEKACQKIAFENRVAKKDDIVEITIGANTTMLQIAALIDPTPLGYLPFKTDIVGGKIFPASLFGLKVNKNAKVYLPPILHAFVGSDISAGLLRCPEFFDNSKSVLYLDMGTNGEICLNVKGRRFATSTAAGPAFEGMGILSGMRATDGAVERVEVQNGRIIFHVIGQKDIKGVCGSGIVDLIAALLTTNHLNKLGKLQFKNQFCYGDNIYLTQKDIRQIQLAKSAVRTGIDLILEKCGITCEILDKIYIAGGFGNFLNPKNMEKIGLFPNNSADKVFFCGNACIDGSIMLLIDKNNRYFLESALHNIEHIQLADSPEFMNHFIKNLNFS